MNHDLYVLRALARLSRQRKTVDCESLAIRAGGSLEDVRGALERLARAGLIVGAGIGPNAAPVRLTFSGLAVAVASGKVEREARATRGPARRRVAPPVAPSRAAEISALTAPSGEGRAPAIAAGASAATSTATATATATARAHRRRAA